MSLREPDILCVGISGGHDAIYERWWAILLRSVPDCLEILHRHGFGVRPCCSIALLQILDRLERLLHREACTGVSGWCATPDRITGDPWPDVTSAGASIPLLVSKVHFIDRHSLTFF